MRARKAGSRANLAERGNFISEWFGHRMYPTVAHTGTALQDQRNERCPFLSAVIREETKCVKALNARGICTISSRSNRVRQDWLVCPYRALDSSLLENAVRRLFAIDNTRTLLVVPAPILARQEVRDELINLISTGHAGLVYLQNKLGGEIALAATEHSPEFSFDSTIVELVYQSGRFDIGRYGIFEVQTMDFHGSYRYAVQNLKDALRLHGDNFPHVLQGNLGWLSDHIEGPNIANVFKRIFYQMMFKFQIGAHASCAGCILAIPLSVWDSWQKHLGKPELAERSDGIYLLKGPDSPAFATDISAWIYVFDIEASSTISPNPLKLCKIIATDAESVSYHTLKVAPEAALTTGGSADRLLMTIRRRLALWWPDFSSH